MHPILLSVLLYHDFSQNVKYIFVQKGRSFSSAFLFRPKAAAVFSAQAERGHKLRTRFILSGRLLFFTG